MQTKSIAVIVFLLLTLPGRRPVGLVDGLTGIIHP